MKVSIIIPVYNVADYIERCISSVMNQTYSDIECIIVDDATPDDSIVKCKRLITDYKGPIIFSILHHEKNKGLSSTRNAGIEAASGEYFYYLDSDDAITPNCIETLLKPIIVDPSIEMVQGNHIMIKDEKETLFYNRSYPITIASNNDVLDHFIRYHNIFGSVWNKLIKRSFVEKHLLYFKDGIYFEDYLWMFYAQKYLSRVYISKEVTYYYYRRSSSITCNTNKKEEGNYYNIIYQDILQHLTTASERKELKGYVLRFGRAYCSYVDMIPSYKETYELYCEQAKKNNCWYAFFILNAIELLRKLGNPIECLKKINVIRWKLIEWYDSIFRK